MRGTSQTTGHREPVVLLVEGNVTLRDTIRTFLTQRLPVQVVEAASASQALRLVAEHRPDVILLDLSLPDWCGVDAMSALQSARPDAQLIALLSSPEVPPRAVAAQLGSWSCVAKEALGSELAPLVWRVLPSDRLDLPWQVSRRWAIVRGSSLGHGVQSGAEWIERGICWLDRNGPWAGQPRTRLLYLANVAMIALTFVLRQHGVGM